jgi:hypothetical protein
VSDRPAPLAWYRPAVLSQLVVIAVTSALLVCAGMTLVGLAFWSFRVGPNERAAIAGLGFLGVIGGPLTLILRWHRLLVAEDGYLALHRDGLELELPGLERFVAWDDLAAVRAEADALVLELRAGEAVRVPQAWNGASRAEVARAIETTRKRAGLGMLR